MDEFKMEFVKVDNVNMSVLFNFRYKSHDE